MGEFFRFMFRFSHGWRRKCGLLLLMTAMSVLTIWLRGFFFRDQIVFAVGEDSYSVECFRGTAMFQQFYDAKSRQQIWTTLRTNDDNTPSPIRHHEPFVGHGVDGIAGEWWYLRREDLMRPESIRWNRPQYGTRRFRSIEVPMWSLILPLTFISAFLLLSNPHKSNQKKMALPVTN